MAKGVGISAASHERRVAILEEGQLVEIYIEREKEFALVGSIYKGKVTRVLPGMQSAFVDIGLDGDAFLYVSDVFENLEDYDPVHSHEQPQSSAPALPAAIGAPVEVLPGETLAHAARLHDEALQQPSPGEEAHHVHEGHGSHDEAHAAEGDHLEQHHEDAPPAEHDEAQAEAADERQPDSNASAPQNTLRRRAVKRAATTIAEASHAVTTTGVKTPRTAPVLLLRQTPTRSPSFFPANRSQNIAASPQRYRHRRQWLSTKRMISSLKRRKLRRGQLATWPPPPPQAAPTFPAGSRVAFPAGCWPMPALEVKQPPPVGLRPLWKKRPPPRARFSNPNLCEARSN